MSTDRDRLARQKARPALVEMHRALTRLTSTLTVMNTGAHPDDEHSAMLAAMRFAYGMRVIVACSTRGEGGQNSLGPERMGALGVVRTRELEAAARTLDGDVVWLGFGPDDAVHDFGFSKNGRDTLSRWGRETIIERLVRAYRTERPDIVIPTFLDVPGQHGHHRAMTEAAAAAIALAADPTAFLEHFEEGLTPWQVAKFYLPAWSGGGGTYDDEVPPPNATLVFTAPGRDAATGAPYADIGQWSRAYHLTQGMGRWSAVKQAEWPLHLETGGTAAESDIRDGLPADLAGVGALVNPAAGEALRGAHRAIHAALEAFPKQTEVLAALLMAADAIEQADADLKPKEHRLVGHRLARKRMEVEAAIHLALGLSITAWLDQPVLAPGTDTMLNVHVETDGAAVEVQPAGPDGVTITPASPAPGLRRFTITAAPDAAPTSPWAADFSSMGGNGALYLRVTTEIDDRPISAFIDIEEPLEIVPAHAVSFDPPALIVPLPPDGEPLPVGTLVEGPPATVTVMGTDGLAVARDGEGLMVTPAPALDPGRHKLAATIDGGPAFGRIDIAYPHIGRACYVMPRTLDVLALDLALPAGARVGYVGGGADNVGTWLMRMGLDATTLDAGDLGGPLERYSTIVVGIFAFGLRPDLAAARSRLKAWVEAGGHLVTLYHRPSDGWNPDRTPPARLVIGSPSLRWRVTDPAAPVEVLSPRHKLLTYPNAIGPEDWAGWDKERGLYFAAEWDSAYEPVLAMHDAGEAPLEGALVSAAIGTGRHTHVSLVLHHQMDRLVPGAFRLMANLVQPA